MKPAANGQPGTGLGAVELEQVFAACFGSSHNTELAGGAEEPLYTPASAGRPALIRYRADWPASALHEVAHWCIAGPQRRQLQDYGYWYAPDGRAGPDQARFLAVEARPQALEQLFAAAAGVPFCPSLDNLAMSASAEAQLRAAFAAALDAASTAMMAEGLPPRAHRFRAALAAARAVQQAA